MKVTTDQILTEKIDIHVDNSGQFWAEFNDMRYTADTRMKLLEDLKKAVKAAEGEKAVPVTLINVSKKKEYSYGGSAYSQGRGIVHCRVRGKHGREYNTFLFVTDDGTKFKRSTHDAGDLCRRLSESEIAEYERLTKIIDAAEADFNGWLKGVTISPSEALKLDE